MLSSLSREKPYLYLILILILAAFLRFYGLNWDQNNKLHPDERMIIMTALNIRLPQTQEEWQNVFTSQSTLNPKFFAYGNFPVYLLKSIGSLAGTLNPRLSSYDQIHLVGRALSAIFDIGILITLFLIAKKLFNETVGLLTAFFYTVSVLPIQLAHFYAVDTPLTFFVLLTLYQLIRFYEKPTLVKSILVGFLFGISLATKTSALVLLSSIGAALIVDFLLILIKNPYRPHIWFPHLPVFIKRLFVDGLIIAVITVITFVIFEPFALIDSQTFLSQTQEQRRMTYDPFTFPYTLQYVGKIPYLYEIKNIFFWGLGPILAILSFIGIFCVTYLTIKQSNNKIIILLTFFWVYFLVVGNFAIGFMRYMLPVYPILCLSAAVLVWFIFSRLKHLLSNNLFLILYSIFVILILIWPLSFMNIYSKPNTRMQASEWAYQHIKPRSNIAREHWDDGLPIGRDISYNILELPIYEIELPTRQDQIYQTVNQADYIIIASNRLYVPLQKIARNCDVWNIPQKSCPKNANEYYKKLFNGTLGFQKIAEFSIVPKVPFLNITIDDQSADESFTVYDHPKVMIFKKTNLL